MFKSKLWALAGAFIVLALLIATVWALRQGDDRPSLPVAAATMEANQTPTPTSSTVASTPFQQATPTAPPLVPFPENAVMIVAHGGYAHGSGGYFWLTRHYRDRSGELRTDLLLKPPDGSGAVITGIVANELGELFASTCFGEFCGYESGTEGSSTVFTKSTDGGITWREIGSSAGKWWARAAVDAGVVVINFEGQSLSYALFPRGTPIVPPPAARASIDPIIFRRAARLNCRNADPGLWRFSSLRIGVAWLPQREGGECVGASARWPHSARSIVPYNLRVLVG
ncbi:MAG: hypothetical protein ABIP13_01645 [Tepidiformaceae bacterium]